MSGNNSKKTTGGKEDKKNPSSKEESPTGAKENGIVAAAATGSNGPGSSNEGSQPSSKPGSAGASIREAAQRLLGLASRGEWTPVDQLLKQMEKTLQGIGEEGTHAPLAGVQDLVKNNPMMRLYCAIL